MTETKVTRLLTSPSSAALNPTNTLLANALRVADHLRERLGWVETPAVSQALL